VRILRVFGLTSIGCQSKIAPTEMSAWRPTTLLDGAWGRRFGVHLSGNSGMRQPGLVFLRSMPVDPRRMNTGRPRSWMKTHSNTSAFLAIVVVFPGSVSAPRLDAQKGAIVKFHVQRGDNSAAISDALVLVDTQIRNYRFLAKYKAFTDEKGDAEVEVDSAYCAKGCYGIVSKEGFVGANPLFRMDDVRAGPIIIRLSLASSATAGKAAESGGSASGTSSPGSGSSNTADNCPDCSSDIPGALDPTKAPVTLGAMVPGRSRPSDAGVGGTANGLSTQNPSALDQNQPGSATHTPPTQTASAPPSSDIPGALDPSLPGTVTHAPSTAAAGGLPQSLDLNTPNINSSGRSSAGRSGGLPSSLDPNTIGIGSTHTPASTAGGKYPPSGGTSRRGGSIQTLPTSTTSASGGSQPAARKAERCGELQGNWALTIQTPNAGSSKWLWQIGPRSASGCPMAAIPTSPTGMPGNFGPFRINMTSSGNATIFPVKASPELTAKVAQVNERCSSGQVHIAPGAASDPTAVAQATAEAQQCWTSMIVRRLAEKGTGTYSGSSFQYRAAPDNYFGPESSVFSGVRQRT
jgi:hypothetical protein